MWSDTNPYIPHVLTDLTDVGDTTQTAGNVLQSDGTQFVSTPLSAETIQQLANFYADAGNTSTTETDLHSLTLTANQLSANGQKIEASYSGITLGSATATSQFKIKFGPSGSETTIFDSGALGLSTNTDWNFKVEIIRESSTVVRCMVTAFTTGASATPYATYTRITGLTLSNAQVLKITGTRAGVGAASNDILAKFGAVQWKPSA